MGTDLVCFDMSQQCSQIFRFIPEKCLIRSGLVSVVPRGNLPTLVRRFCGFPLLFCLLFILLLLPEVPKETK